MNSGCLDLCQMVNSLSHWANFAGPKVLFFKYIDIKQKERLNIDEFAFVL